MYASTTGNGPFYAVIVFDGYNYVAPNAFETENEAFAFAQLTYRQAVRAFISAAKNNGFRSQSDNAPSERAH